MVWDVNCNAYVTAMRMALLACPSMVRAVSYAGQESARIHSPYANPDGTVSGALDPMPLFLLIDQPPDYQFLAEQVQQVRRGLMELTMFLPADPSGTVAAATLTTTGTVTQGSAIITNIPSTASYDVGRVVTGSGIPAQSQIASINSGNSITLTNTATVGGAGVALSILPLVYTTSAAEALGQNIATELMPQNVLGWRAAFTPTLGSDPTAGEWSNLPTVHRTITLRIPYGLNA